jgi:hypothetical protein
MSRGGRRSKGSDPIAKRKTPPCDPSHATHPSKPGTQREEEEAWRARPRAGHRQKSLAGMAGSVSILGISHVAGRIVREMHPLTAPLC